jgi:hypothetical protein
MSNTADVTGGKSIAVLMQYISGVSAINPLVVFYDPLQNPWKKERGAILLFCPGHHTRHTYILVRNVRKYTILLNQTEGSFL